MRSNYTFKIVKSPDISYNLTTMALWTLGEITCGFLTACLPTFPRFFQHVVSKSRSNVEKNSAPSNVKDRQEIPGKLKRPFDKYIGGLSISGTWSNVGTRQDSRKGDSITLHEFEVIASGNTMNGQSRATYREDLESGHHHP